MNLIVAVNNKNYIGRNGELMWQSTEDLQYFKQITMGATLICGRVTWVQCLKKKPLKGRSVVVVGKGYETLENALKIAKESDNVFIIGGAKIYEAFMPYVKTIYLSNINDNQVGDKQFFIPLDFKGDVIIKNFKNGK